MKFKAGQLAVAFFGGPEHDALYIVLNEIPGTNHVYAVWHIKDSLRTFAHANTLSPVNPQEGESEV